jgi:hypothetical protein
MDQPTFLECAAGHVIKSARYHLPNVQYYQLCGILVAQSNGVVDATAAQERICNLVSNHPKVKQDIVRYFALCQSISNMVENVVKTAQETPYRYY